MSRDDRALLAERDVNTRRLAQCEFERPMVVVAGAGTGKTALLVARVVAWCVGPGWSRHETADRSREDIARRVVERVAAITFTEAAAAEMARKISEALVRLASPCGEPPKGWEPDPQLTPSDDEVAVRAAALSQEAHRLQASTIHGFCQRLLRTYPIEAGVHPHFEVDADGSRLEEIIAAVVEEALRGLDDDPGRRHWERLAEDGVGPPQVAAAVRLLIDDGLPPDALDEDPFQSSAVTTAADRTLICADSLLTAEGGRLHGVRAPKSVATLEAVAMLAERLRGLERPPTLEDLVEAAGSVGDPERERLKDWSRLRFGKQEGERLGGFGPAVSAAAADLLGAVDSICSAVPEALTAARTVLSPLIGEVERRRRAAGVVTFSDLLRCAKALLDGAPGVRREVQQSIDQLLVDEFQDTDQVQCRIVSRLALDGSVAERPGLFVVGDPKQSIYAWRNADLRAYDEFIELVRRRRGRVEPLIRNFRSYRPILDEVEAVIEPIMRGERGVQPAFEPLQATDERTEGPGFEVEPWSAVEHWAAWPTVDGGPPAPVTGRERAANELEAGALADDICRLHDTGGVAWTEIAVLLRATTGQDELLEAFRKRGVPYEVAREREYYRQREVVEAAALVRCLLEPTDTLALLTVLRSDVVGVPDAALAPLWDEGLPARMARLTGCERGSLEAALQSVERAAECVDPTLPGLASLPGWPRALRAAVTTLAELRESLSSDPPDVFVEKVRTLWLAEVSAAARFLGGFRRARLDRFFADLEARLSAGTGGDAMLARFLRQAVADGAASTVTVEPDRSADAVHVMTIHGAKGLDFGHVYLVQTHRGGRGGGSSKEAEIGRIDGHLEYRLFAWQTLGFGSLRRLFERQEYAERVRLLYVAMTRAKERLVISGAWKQPGRVFDPVQAGSFADLLAPRGALDELEAQAVAGEARRRGGERCVQWVLPALVGAGDNEPRPGRSSVITPDLAARARRDGESLSVARDAARKRMTRPLVGAASALAHAMLERQGSEDGSPIAGPWDSGRETATVVGSAVHRLLERLDLEREPAPQISKLGERARAEVAVAVGRALADGAVERLDDLLAAMASGECLARLGAVRPRVAARELPVLLPATGDEGPVAVVSGFVDLVYRDPDDDRLVVADYKTDHLEDEDAIRERVEIYEPQVRTYAAALRDALSLDHEPHVELWFLSADRIIRL